MRLLMCLESYYLLYSTGIKQDLHTKAELLLTRVPRDSLTIKK